MQLAIANFAAYCPPEILVRWLSGRKQRFAKAPYLKRVPRVRIPPSPPRFTFSKIDDSDKHRARSNNGDENLFDRWGAERMG
jgi:hypothetical protein